MLERKEKEPRLEMMNRNHIEIVYRVLNMFILEPEGNISGRKIENDFSKGD